VTREGYAVGLVPEDLFEHPNALAPDYSEFRVGERLLLTGHSHQAWPDVGLSAQEAAWHDAARLVDEKWGEAFARAAAVREGFARLLGVTGRPDDGDYALGGSTHELVIRFLSALSLSDRPRLVTTDGEFHTIRRQLDRLGEEEVEIVKVAVDPVESLADRAAAAMDARTAAALVSSVLYRDARIVPDLAILHDRCERLGAPLLIDAYHALDALPFPLLAGGLAGAFVVGGGYKYCQLGEGNCFLRSPPGCSLRPVITGWFSEFGLLETGSESGAVAYGGGADRFAGSTYDPTSHYRAAAVLEFFADRGLTPELLRQVSQHQVGRLARRFDELDADRAIVTRPDVPLAGIGGFLALRSDRAAELRAGLRARGVLTDHRDDVLRLGPAPYLSDRQLDDAIIALGETIRELSRSK
jgi:kynureninase